MDIILFFFFFSLTFILLASTVSAAFLWKISDNTGDMERRSRKTKQHKYKFIALISIDAKWDIVVEPFLAPSIIDANRQFWVYHERLKYDPKYFWSALVDPDTKHALHEEGMIPLEVTGYARSRIDLEIKTKDISYNANPEVFFEI